MNNAPEFFIEALREEVRYQANVVATSQVGSLTHVVAKERLDQAIAELAEATYNVLGAGQ